MKTELIQKSKILVDDFSELINRFANGENRITIPQYQYMVERMNHYNKMVYQKTCPEMELCHVCGFVKQSGYDGYRCYNHDIETQISVGFRMMFGVGA